MFEIADEYVNLIDRGIFDSLVVSKATVEDSVSVASMILTTDVAIVLDKTYTRKIMFYLFACFFLFLFIRFFTSTQVEHLQKEGVLIALK